MIPELGVLCLVVALALSAALAVLPTLGVARDDARLQATARPIAAALFGALLLAFACQISSFLAADFSVLNVASHANSELPTHFRFSAAWGSHEGSMLLWVLMLTGWTAAVAARGGALPRDVLCRVLAVLGALNIGFLLFILLTSNPFERLIPAAPEGRDLNPLLQDPGMIFHPPLLYMGYVGFAVAFAFAIAALWAGRLDAAWARFARPWTLAAWMFLTGGIALGSFWAYYELGWGGWWFWDPVENASFMPWLVGTALIHSLAVTEKRGAFKSWTVLLAILAFSLSLLGTFLVRSGVLTSVHAFATDPKRGAFILIFLLIVVGAALTLFAWRAGAVARGVESVNFSWRSREAFLLGNNVLMVVAMASVLLGTLYPLIVDALGMGKISVGPPYFEAVFTPFMALCVLLMMQGPQQRWRDDDRTLSLDAQIVLGIMFASFLIDGFFRGQWSTQGPWVVGALALVFFTIRAFLVRRHSGESVSSQVRRSARAPLSQWGMAVAHIGVAVFILGVVATMTASVSQDVVLKRGQTVALGQYQFTLRSIEPIKGPNYDGVRALIDAKTASGDVLPQLAPEKRRYRASGQVMTEAAIDMGILRHVFVSLADEIEPGVWGARLQVKPLISWIWWGCIFMALGALLALLDRRYRQAKVASRTHEIQSAPA